MLRGVGPTGYLPPVEDSVAGQVQIQFDDEQESASGWEYRVTVVSQANETRLHVVVLSFQDYDHWSKGSVPPELVVKAVMRVLVGGKSVPDPLPERIDAGLARRWLTDADQLIRSEIGR